MEEGQQLWRRLYFREAEATDEKEEVEELVIVWVFW
jgi:hypothetical protein